MKRPDAPTPDQFDKARCRIALNYAPEIRTCQKCRWPVLKGFCCTFCGDTNPSEKESDK